MKKENWLLLVASLSVILSLAYAALTIEEPEPEQKMLRGYIMHVDMGEAVYFKDGTILKEFREKDYVMFLGHDDKEITITYDEDWFGGKELIRIVETPVMIEVL